MISKKLLLFGFLLLVFTVFLSVKTVQGFQVNCSTISDCGTCGNTYGCTFCKTAQKCVNNNDFNTLCPNDTRINTAEDCVDCSTYTDCRSCTIVRDSANPNIDKRNDNCVWCKTSNKCVSDLSSRQLCPRESTASESRACGIMGENTNREIKYVNGVAYGVTYDASGNQTIDTIPYIFDKDNSINALRSQLDSGVYSSDKTTGQPTDIFYTQNNKSTNTFDYSNISLSYPGDSVIPILGLQRDSTGHLLKSSLKTIVDSAKVSGLITSSGSKQPLLDALQKESNFYKEQKKEYMKKFLNNSVDYIDDEDSLKKIKEIDIKIMDLNDISGYVKGIEEFQNKFKEGYQNINQKDVFEYTLMKNKGVTGYMQFLWALNLIGIGTFLYFINNK
uniref:PSI domain-containing protein n=1 Tax=viral metagenome TaxID=1070528 RepID=A0A6C0IDS1_9ZZZZ